jgi:lactate dehydrogenase-like 2-hydroxyacid dehydrogenase
MKVGLMGFGKAGLAVARVLKDSPETELCWIMQRREAHASHEELVRFSSSSVLQASL